MWVGHLCLCELAFAKVKSETSEAIFKRKGFKSLRKKFLGSRRHMYTTKGQR
jgi:hypothetical protein